MCQARFKGTVSRVCLDFSYADVNKFNSDPEETFFRNLNLKIFHRKNLIKPLYKNPIFYHFMILLIFEQIA